MRKTDYSLLAHLLREKIRTARMFDMKEYAEQFEMLAHQFAQSASVDKREFLKACGIE